MSHLTFSVDSIDLRDAIKRQLYLPLFELVTKINRLRTWSSNHRQYICDYSLHELLKEFNVFTRKSCLLSFYYGKISLLERLYYKIKSRFILSKSAEPKLYVWRNPGKKKILWVAQSSHRNKGFFRQILFLKSHYECYFLNTTTSWEPDSSFGLEEVIIDCTSTPNYLNLAYSCTNSSKITDPINTFLDSLIRLFINNNQAGLIYYVRLFKELLCAHEIDLCVTGLPFSYINGVALAVCQANNVKTAYLQDTFFIEGHHPLEIPADYLLTFQENLQIVINNHRPYVFKSAELEHISIDASNTTEKLGYACARDIVSDRSSFSLKNNELVLAALHPVFEPFTATCKYNQEKTLLTELAFQPVTVIVKLHPQDNSGITEKVLKEIRPNNIWLVQDNDFDTYLEACDLFIGSASTSVHQAISAKKKVAVLNYGGYKSFSTAIRCGAAFSIEHEGDVSKFVHRSISASEIESRCDRYIHTYHKVASSQDDILGIISSMISDKSTLRHQ